MKKSFILLALIAYFVIGAYSVTRTKNAALNAVNAQSPATESTAAAFKLFTQQPEVLMKFYHEAFGTDWQVGENSYQGDVLNARVQIIPAKPKKRTRQATLYLLTNDLAALADNLLAAGGAFRTQGRSYLVNDPDGNLIVLSRQ